MLGLTAAFGNENGRAFGNDSIRGGSVVQQLLQNDDMDLQGLHMGANRAKHINE